MYGESEDAQIRAVDAWLHTRVDELDSEILIKHWW